MTNMNDQDELRELFNLIDYDLRGFILVDDMISILDSLHEDSKSTLLYQILTYLKINGKDKLFYEGFVELLTKKLTNLEDEEDLEKIYGVYRQDNPKIKFETLKVLAKNLGERADDDDLRNMLLIADPDQNG